MDANFKGWERMATAHLPLRSCYHSLTLDGPPHIIRCVYVPDRETQTFERRVEFRSRPETPQSAKRPPEEPHKTWQVINCRSWATSQLCTCAEAESSETDAVAMATSTRPCDAESHSCIEPPSQSSMPVKTYTWVSLWFLLTAPVSPCSSLFFLEFSILQIIAWDVGYCFMRCVFLRCTNTVLTVVCVL